MPKVTPTPSLRISEPPCWLLQRRDRGKRSVYYIVFLLAVSVPFVSAQEIDPRYSVYGFVGELALERAIVDGTAEEARFLSLSRLWGDDSAIYATDDRTLRRIDRDTGEVTSVTRTAGGPGVNFYGPGVKSATGLRGLWGDDRFLYAADIGENALLRIDRQSGQTEMVRGNFRHASAVWGDEDRIYIGADGDLLSLDTASGESSLLAEPGIPPPSCPTPSSCLNAVSFGPTGLWGDLERLYVSGPDREVLSVDLESGEISVLLETPWNVNSITGCDGRLFIEGGGGIFEPGAEIGVFDLADRSYSTLLKMYADGLWCDGDELFFVAGATEIGVLNVDTGRVRRFAGYTSSVYQTSESSTDGVGIEAVANARDLWADPSFVYFVDANGTVRRADRATAEVITIAGSPGSYGAVDGVGGEARFSPWLRRIWGSQGELYVSDWDRIRHIDTATFAVTTVAAGFREAWSICGARDRLYAVDIDPLEQHVVEIDLNSGLIETIVSGFSFRVEDIWCDGTDLYLAHGREVLRVSLASGEVTQVAGFFDTVSVQGIWGVGDQLWVSGPDVILDLGTGAIRQPRQADGSPVPHVAWWDGAEGYAISGRAISRIVRLDSIPEPEEQNIRLPDLGFVTDGTVGEAPGLRTGYSRLSPGGSSLPLATATFTLSKGDGVVSEASVAATPAATAGRLYATIGGVRNTAVAMVNPGPRPAEVTFYLTSDRGIDRPPGSFVIEPGQQVARFLSEPPFGISGNFTGSFTFESSQPVAVLAIHGVVNERSEFLMSAVPIARLEDPSVAQQFIPHISVGGGRQTLLVLTNPSDEAITGTFELPGFGSASPFGPSLRTLKPASGAFRSRYSVAGRASATFLLDSPSETALSSFVRITPADGPAPLAYGRIAQTVNGTLVHETTVLGTEAARVFRYFAPSGIDPSPGVAIVNPGNEPVEVRIDLLSSYGTRERDGGLRVVPPDGRFFGDLAEIDVPYGPPWITVSPGRDGSLIRVSADSDIVVMPFRTYVEQGLTFAAPVTAESSEPSTGSTYLPYFVDGSGYRTFWAIFPNQVHSKAEATFGHYSPLGKPVRID